MRPTTTIVRRLLLPIGASLLAVTGTAVAVVLASAGGPHPAVPHTPSMSAAADRALPAVTATPTVRPSAPASAAAPAAAASSTAASSTAVPAVAPLHGLQQPDLLIVAPFSLSGQVRSAVAGQAGVTGTNSIEAARVTINGTQEAVLGVDPSTFRGFAAGPTAKSDPLWQGVAAGGVAVSYDMGTQDKLALGGPVTVTGRQPEQLRVTAFGTVGIGGVDAVVSDSVAESLGVPAGNAMVISASPSSLVTLATRLKSMLPAGASLEPLVTLVTTTTTAGVTSTSVVSSQAGVSSLAGVSGTGYMSAAQLTTALRAAQSRVGLPYVWGAAGPTSFDCSGLVQWSFAQAGVTMPRVAADQARTGPAVPVSQLEPGDLLFYHTDPTAPGYISHVAIYLGNGQMIQAPQTGENVEIVPADFGSAFAGAVRVGPPVAAQAAVLA
jgi:cell wall-associated NlpC family hydrolase